MERYEGPTTKIVLVTPHKWKGNLPKHVTEARVLQTLTREEKGVIPRIGKNLIHNVYDAIGIGLYHLGRKMQNVQIQDVKNSHKVVT